MREGEEEGNANAAGVDTTAGDGWIDAVGYGVCDGEEEGDAHAADVDVAAGDDWIDAVGSGVCEWEEKGDAHVADVDVAASGAEGAMGREKNLRGKI